MSILLVAQSASHTDGLVSEGCNWTSILRDISHRGVSKSPHAVKGLRRLPLGLLSRSRRSFFLPASDTCLLLTYRMLSLPRGRVAEALSWRWQPPHHVYDLPATTGEPLSMPCRHISSKQRGKPWFFADIRTCGPHLAPSATKGTTVMNMASSCSRRSSNACIRGTIQLDRAHASCWSSLRPQCMSVWVFHRTCAMFR
jgi:hypothetical protein